MKALMTALIMVCVATVGFGQVTTSVQGRNIQPICKIDYEGVLKLAGGQPTASAVLILDLTNLTPSNAGARSFFYVSPSSDLTVLIAPIHDQCQQTEANQDFSMVVKSMPTKQTQPTRWIATSGDSLWILVLHMIGTDKQIRIDETKRKSHIASDLADLGKLVPALQANAAAVAMVAFPYALRETRADLKITITDSDGKNEQTVLETKSGPVEHYSLSANIPINTVKQLTVDDSHHVVMKDAPKEFLFAGNYQLGDVYEDYHRVSTNRVFFTGMVRFSKQPLETVGAGIGYKFGFASLFGGPIWIHEAAQAADATATTATSPVAKHYKMSWRIGFVFDLGTAVDWASKSKK
jgi:hypothetical protein